MLIEKITDPKTSTNVRTRQKMRRVNTVCFSCLRICRRKLSTTAMSVSRTRHSTTPFRPLALEFPRGADSPGPCYGRPAPDPPVGVGAAWPTAQRFDGLKDQIPPRNVGHGSCIDHHASPSSPIIGSQQHGAGGSTSSSPVAGGKGRAPRHLRPSPLRRSPSAAALLSPTQRRDHAHVARLVDARAQAEEVRARIRASVLDRVLTSPEDLEAYHLSAASKSAAGGHSSSSGGGRHQSGSTSPAGRRPTSVLTTFGSKGPSLEPERCGPGPAAYDGLLPRGLHSTKRYAYLTAALPSVTQPAAGGDGSSAGERPISPDITPTRPRAPAPLLDAGRRTPLKLMYSPPTGW